MQEYVYMVVAILAVNLLVLVHELGHLLAGKLLNVHVLRFCVGLGPRLTGFRYKGTDYCLAPIPLGGYVRLASESGPGASPGSLTGKPAWQKAVIFVAGPLANALFALAVIYAIKLLHANPVDAMEATCQKMLLLTRLVVDSFIGLATCKIPPSELVGPVFLFNITAKAASSGLETLLYFLAFISTNLFIFNLLPLPVLDGGQIVLAFVNKTLRRPLHPRSMRLLTHASLVWLILILATATLNDIVRILAS